MENLKLFSLGGLIIYFAILLFVVIKTRKNKNIEDYFFAGRSLPFWALAITFIASWWGAGSAISTADLAFEDGLSAFWYYGVPVLISTTLILLFAKSIRRIGCYTQGTMLEQRYNKTSATLLSFMIFWFMTVTAASQMVVVGEFFKMYLNLDYSAAVLCGTAIVFIYSLFGGFRGVVITDIIQFIFLLIAALTIFGVALYTAGGFSGITQAASEAGKPEFMSFFSKASDYMAYVITFGAAWMIQANVWQRISAARTENDARKMTLLSLGAYLPLYLIVVVTGMAGLAIYKQLPAGGLVPAIIRDHMHPALGGLMFVGICSAIMSTMDSLINTGALTLSVDFYQNRICPGAEKKQLVLASQISTTVVTVIAILIALRVKSFLKISWLAADIITTGAFVPLVAGFFWRRGTGTGAVISMVTGIIYCSYNLIHTFGVKIPIMAEPGSTGSVITGIILSLMAYVGGSLLSAPEYTKADKFIAKAGFIKAPAVEGALSENR
ncbi:sodium:solute symporter family protein [Lentisphaerota bacterium ZTH]|nr:sodium:solute symporter family protein [Lentisphaerota bacterium]WET05370.1 sodium:solute symporter family protein [Lentisphaerota bacterium ZTH]